MAGKISELTARAVANLGAATTALEVTTNLTTTPVSGYVTAGTLLQWMMANITTDVAVNTNKFQITAATGNVGVGGAAAATAAVLVQSTGLTGVTQYAVNASAVFNGATTAGKAIYAGVRTAAAAFTMVTGYGAHIYAPSIGAGSAITTLYGIYVDNQGAAGVTNAYGLYLAAQSGAATINRGFYNGGDSQLVGTVGIGATPSTDTALYIPITTLATSSQYGIYVAPTFSSAGTTAAYDVFAKVTTAAAAYTLTSGHAFFANTPTIGAGSAITNAYGLYVNNQGTTGVTNAYGVYIATQSGAATTNIGLYNAGTSQFQSGIGIATAGGSAAAINIQGMTFTGTSQYGINVGASMLFSSAATTVGYGIRVSPTTAASAFTMTDFYGLKIDATVKGVGSTITNRYGLQIDTPTDGGTNWALAITAGQVYFRNSALATNATVGHLFIPTSAGAPTGVPASIPTGQVAFQYDSTNNQLYVYNGAWKKTVALT